MVLSKLITIKNGLQNSFILCEAYFETLSDVTFVSNDILKWFQGLCHHLTTIITQISHYYKETDKNSTRSTQNTLLLYLTQLLTSLSLLINIFVREEEIQLVLVEARKCVTKQLTTCLESISVAIDCDSSLTDPSGNFVKWMDAALEKIPEISRNVEIYDEVRQLFEEVLSHAMSIAQVSLSEDSKSIRGGCQAVLNALHCLEEETSKKGGPNGAMVNLFINSCSDKLCILEKKVNVAVLRLCLATFAKFTEPLDKIQDFCYNNGIQNEDFDGMVADFDLHVDRIMQIGLFAVSCSSDTARGVKIRSCLASLEALESELVPSLTAVSIDNSLHNVNCADILAKHWLNQAKSLQKLIFLIIDPFAFCQIIYEEAADIVDNLSNCLRKKCLIRQIDVENLVSTVKVLHFFLNSAQSEFDDREKSAIGSRLKDFDQLIQEVESASKLLLSEENVNFDNSKRVLKRCRILLTVLKRLWYCFVDDIDKNKTIGESESGTVAERELPTSNLENLQIEPTGNVFLDHIINRGKQILHDRSVLYRTPVKKNQHKSTQSRRKQEPLSKLVHLRKFSFLNVHEKNVTSLDLQITDILNEMTNLSTILGTKK